MDLYTEVKFKVSLRLRFKIGKKFSCDIIAPFCFNVVEILVAITDGFELQKQIRKARIFREVAAKLLQTVEYVTLYL